MRLVAKTMEKVVIELTTDEIEIVEYAPKNLCAAKFVLTNDLYITITQSRKVKAINGNSP